jgi:hypothetical protein
MINTASIIITPELPGLIADTAMKHSADLRPSGRNTLQDGGEIATNRSFPTSCRCEKAGR